MVDDKSKLSGLAFELQQKAAILDYLPKTAKQAPQSVAPSNPEIITGDGQTFGYEVGSDRFSFEAEMYSNGTIVVPVMYFPGWITILDNTQTDIRIHGDYGLISVDVPQGRHIIRGRFSNTPIREVGNSLSVITILFLIGGLAMFERRKEKL